MDLTILNICVKSGIQMRIDITSDIPIASCAAPCRLFHQSCLLDAYMCR